KGNFVICFLPMQVGFLITNYKATKLATEAVQALRKYEPASPIVVVDNCTPLSTEDVEHFQSFGNVAVVQNPRNLGYSASVNIGFRTLADCDIVFIHDADALATMPISEPLLAEARHHREIGVWGFKLVDRQGRPTGNASPSRTPMELLLGPLAERAMSMPSLRFLFPERPLGIHSCAMAVRHEVWERVNGFDENFELLESDIEFCYRVEKELGLRAQVIDNIVLIHEGGATPLGRSQRMISWHCASMRFFNKHKLIKHPRLFKLGLFGRHATELIITAIGGRLLWPDKWTRNDRLRYRWRLLTGVFNDYRDGRLL
ncbi:MAG: glycosyltransferase, partial [Acidobacteriota bacterium]